MTFYQKFIQLWASLLSQFSYFSQISCLMSLNKSYLCLLVILKLQKMEQLKTIKELINQGDVEQAIQKLDDFLQTSSSSLDEAYYLRGNAFRKQGNWQQAVNNYQQALELNPEGPAKQAHQMAMNILNFYNKDMYNH